jgi:hypothetical protein
VISKVAPSSCNQRGLPRSWRPEHCPPICFAPFQILEMLQPSKVQLFGPVSACPETDVVFDGEDGRLRSRKHTFLDSTRKVCLETWESDSVLDHSEGSLGPVNERGAHTFHTSRFCYIRRGALLTGVFSLAHRDSFRFLFT